jgi:hypothetical protein
MILNQAKIKYNIIYSCYLVNIYIGNDICYLLDDDLNDEEQFELSFIPKSKIILPSFKTNEKIILDNKVKDNHDNNNNNNNRIKEENIGTETEFQKMMKNMLLEELQEVNLYE